MKKNKLSYLIAFIMLCFKSVGISQIPVSIDHQIAVYSNLEFASLDLCDGLHHIYIQFHPENYLVNSQAGFEEVKSIEVFPLSNPEKKQILSGKMEVEFYSLSTLENGTIPFNVKAKDIEGKTISESQISISTIKNDGVVHISKHLDDKLAGFKLSGKDLFTYFCGMEISKVELLAFFQDYLKLSKTDICKMIDIHNEVFGNGFSSVGNFQLAFKNCELLTKYLTSIKPKSDGCLCNTIQTNSSASNNLFKNREVDYINKCENYTPWQRARNYELTATEDKDLLWSWGRIGAAKAAKINFFYDFCSDSPNDFSTNLADGTSTLEYESICIDPISLKIDDKCNGCVKEIKVQWKYSSVSEVYAETYTCVGGTTRARVQVEDLAVLFGRCT